MGQPKDDKDQTQEQGSSVILGKFPCAYTRRMGAKKLFLWVWALMLLLVQSQEKDVNLGMEEAKW